MLTRYPDGIEGKSFFQKDAPGFAPQWIRRARVYSEDSKREISYFILESAEALKYIANMGAIPVHIWSSRVPNLGSPDWLLFDIDPKGSTTAQAVRVALETGVVLRSAGMRPYVKTSGQAGIHVVVGLRPGYTYEQARMFSEAVARVVVARMPDVATILRTPAARKGKVYIDYLQLGQGKTIAAPLPPVISRISETGSHSVALSAQSAPNSLDMRQASSRTSTVMSMPAPLFRAICKHSSPMLPWPKMATVSPIPICAVSTAATLSLNDCRQAASLSEILSATLTNAISGRTAYSEKHPGN